MDLQAAVTTFRPKVLLVDDHEGNLLALEVPLLNLNCEIVTFTSGLKALEYLETHEVAVMLLDVKMPIIDGFEVARRARQIPSSHKTPIIFISGLEQNEMYLEKMTEVDGFDFIFKPINSTLLSAKVQFFVDLYRKTRELEEKTALLAETLEDEKTKLLENALDAVVSINESNQVTFWNKNAEQLFGWTKNEIMNQDLSVIVPEPYRERHLAGMHRFISSGVSHIQNQRIEIPGLRKSGEQFLMELTVSAIQTPRGYRFYAFMRDISEQKRVQEIVKSSEQTLSQIFDQSLSMMVVLRGPDLVFERANAKYFDFLGRSDIIGKKVEEALPELQAQGFVQILRDVFRTQKPFIGTEVPITMSRPGLATQEFYFNFVYQPLFGPQGESVGIVGQGQDVTNQVLARKRLEDAERKATSEAEKLSLITNAIPDVIAYVDTDERYLFANSAYEDWFNIKGSEMLGKSIQDVVGPVYQSVGPRIREVLKGNPVHFETKIPKLDGGVRSIDIKYIPDFSKAGELRGFVIVAHDVTELQESREIVQNHSKYLELILNIVQAGVILTDPKTGTVKLANHSAKRIAVGLERDFQEASDEFRMFDAQGELVPYDLYPRMRAARGEKIHGAEYTWRTPERTIDLMMFSDLIPEVHGQPATALVSFLDITELKNTERNLRQREEALKLSTRRLEFLAKASKTLNTSLDVDQVLVALSNFVVPELADWCSIRLLTDPGQLKQVAVSHADPEKVKSAWELEKRFPPQSLSSVGPFEVVRTGRPQILNEITDEFIASATTSSEQVNFLKSIGMRSYVCVPIVSRGRITGTLSLVLTEESGRRFTEEDLSLAIELGVRTGIAIENGRLYLEAQAANRLKDEFLANLSHELRTPLNVIQGHAEILKEEAALLLPDDLKESVDAIDRNARVQTAIIADLLDVSSIMTGKVTYKPASLQPSEVVRHTLEGLKPTADSRGIVLTSEFSQAPALVTADPTRIDQILWNLLSNAVKFTEPGGKVHVSVRQLENSWSLQVTDTGRGIDPEFLPYVFDRFRQEDASTTRRYGGLGLGLSIVRHLVELHGGTIRAESKGHGHGSTFIVTLPLQPLAKPESNAELTVQSSIDDLRGSLSDLNVLLIEDSEDGRNLVQRMLSRAGAQVVEAASATDAREKLKTFHPHLIISDIGMPDENGLEFIKRLRSMPGDPYRLIPAVALTAYVRDEEKQAALDAGFQAHVAKPVGAQNLLSTIQTVLKG